MTAVLLTVDDKDLCTALEMVLTRAGFTVHAATSGADGLRIADIHIPDVVLTDLELRDMTGTQLCRSIRANPELADTPVAILSGHVLPGDARLADAHHCGVLIQPYNNTDLIASVTRLADVGLHDHSGGHPLCPSPPATGSAG